MDSRTTREISAARCGCAVQSAPGPAGRENSTSAKTSGRLPWRVLRWDRRDLLRSGRRTNGGAGGDLVALLRPGWWRRGRSQGAFPQWGLQGNRGKRGCGERGGRAVRLSGSRDCRCWSECRGESGAGRSGSRRAHGCRLDGRNQTRSQMRRKRSLRPSFCSTSQRSRRRRISRSRSACAGSGARLVSSCGSAARS